MRIVTITSDNYVPYTSLLLESIRIWHPKIPITVYSLEQGWTEEAGRALEPYGVNIRLLKEEDVSRRQAGTIKTAFKLDAAIEEKEPFLYLDSDILVLRPLDRAFDLIHREGWLSVRDHEPLRSYYEGDITSLVKVDEATLEERSFNAGVVGFNPVTHPQYRRTFEQARDWIGQVSRIYTGDQALQNFAWVHLFGRLPEHAGYTFNCGVGADGTFELGATVVHLCGGARKPIGADKLSNQKLIWNHWPRGVEMVPLVETDWWNQSVPHPWKWINQCTQPLHRQFVREMRRSSTRLRGIPWLVINSPDEAYLIDTEVLKEISDFWASNRSRLAGVPHRPTYHLPGYHGQPSTREPRWKRIGRELRSRLPR
ncbi:MAG: hypothetical protein JJU36_13050 [Phycisphaeraceae bacterium]|nr:hypothetical protein [Phycisphaeraceae bacterium]